MKWFVWVLVLLISYLLGSIPVAYLLVKKKTGRDIRTIGSGNVGSTNTIRAAGRITGYCVFLLDVVKGALAVFAAKLIGGEAMAACAGITVVLGHMYPMWLDFRGGKGVATTFGVGLVLMPDMALAAIITWYILLVLLGRVSVASCGGVALAAVLSVATGKPFAYVVMIFVVTVFVCVRHTSNFRSILRGEEGYSTFYRHPFGGYKNIK